MAERYRDTYVEVISECDLSEKAKTSMVEKVKKMEFLSLYPTAEEYDKLTVQDDLRTVEEGGDLAETLLAVSRYNAYLSRITVERPHTTDMKWWAPLDKFHDNAQPWENNAMHVFNMNQCIFSHVLVAPLFDDNPDGAEELDVKNIAYMATTIGHEIGHGFDGTGCNFDENGHARMNWEASDFEKYDEKMKKTAELYGSISGYLSKVDKIAAFQEGKSVTNEAMADLGGTEIALRLLKDTYPDNDDYIREFYIMNARQWVNSNNDYAEEGELSNLTKDEHPTSHARTNGVASCMDEFYRVFDISSTDAMYIAPEDRVTMWKKAA